MDMEFVEHLKNLSLKAGTTSRSSITYKCSECRDTGFVLTERGTYTPCSCQELEYIKSCWANFGVRPDMVKTISDYTAYNKVCASARLKAERFVSGFEEIRKQENNWFGLFGQPGAGKSHLAIAMGAALLQRGNKPVKAVYMPYLEVMRELKASTMDNEYYTKQISRYQRAEVLVIDDLFKDKVRNGRLCCDLSEADEKHFMTILNFRYLEKLPTIISSECTPRMLMSLDGAVAGRILERCEGNITVFAGEEFNYRLKRFERECKI